MVNDAEKQAQLNKLCLETIRDFSYDTVYFKDKDSRFIWNSLQHARQCNVSDPEQMIGKTDVDFFPLEFAQKAREDELEIMRTGRPKTNIMEEMVREDGTNMCFLASKYPFYDENHEIIGTWGISRDITVERRMQKELQLTNEKLERLSRMDELSGLYNRRHFYESLDTIVAEDDSSVFALVAIDVDNLKFVNDNYGHPCGDKVIDLVSSSMQEAVDGRGKCFRIGGDEFIVLLPGMTRDEANLMAENLMELLASRPITLGDSPYHVTASIGIAMYEKGMDVREVISIADRKLYKSKRNGKNQISN